MKQTGMQKEQENVEQRRLQIEYGELCQDWRQRDKAVLDKLSGAGILFGLLGLAVSTIPPDRILIKLFLLLAGALFSVILSISVAKDTLYRDGTEALLRRLASQLGITKSLKYLELFEDLEHIRYVDDGLDFEELQFPRKIRIPPDKSSLKVFPTWLRNRIEKQPTFSWILAFYIICFLVFASLFILTLVNWIWHLNLPI